MDMGCHNEFLVSGERNRQPVQLAKEILFQTVCEKQGVKAMAKKKKTSFSMPRRYPTEDEKAEMIELFHLARTALNQPSRYERLNWATKQFAREHPEWSMGSIYKSIDELTRPYYNPLDKQSKNPSNYDRLYPEKWNLYSTEKKRNTALRKGRTLEKSGCRVGIAETPQHEWAVLVKNCLQSNPILPEILAAAISGIGLGVGFKTTDALWSKGKKAINGNHGKG